MTETIAEKMCPLCGLVKPASEYSKRKERQDGLQTYCKSCASARYKAWYNAHAKSTAPREEPASKRSAEAAPKPAPKPAPKSAPPAPAQAARVIVPMTPLDVLMHFMPEGSAPDKLIALHDAHQRVMKRRELVRALHAVVIDLVSEPTDALCNQAADLLIELEEVL